MKTLKLGYSTIFCKDPVTKLQNFLRAGHSSKTYATNSVTKMDKKPMDLRRNR